MARDPGQHISVYRLEQPLSLDRHEVWRARDIATGGLVAIKFDVFRREKDALEKLQRCEHVLRLIESLVDPPEADTFALVTELCKTDLGQRLRAGPPLSLDTRLLFARQLLRGLAAIHAEGHVINDLKPANLLIDERGNLKLSDVEHVSGMHTPDNGITATQAMPGTEGFQSPEQADAAALGEDLVPSPTTDVFSSGVILVLLFGVPPSVRRNMTTEVGDLWSDHRSKPEIFTSELEAHLNKRYGPLPPLLVSLLARALQFSPEARFRDGREMADAFEEAFCLMQPAEDASLARTFPPSAVAPLRPRAATSDLEIPKNGATMTIFALVAPLLLAAGFVFEKTRSQPQTQGPASAPAPQSVAASSSGGCALGIPDGVGGCWAVRDAPSRRLVDGVDVDDTRLRNDPAPQAPGPSTGPCYVQRVSGTVTRDQRASAAPCPGAREISVSLRGNRTVPDLFPAECACIQAMVSRGFTSNLRLHR